MGGEDVGFILGAITLGACHCIAWNYSFPTSIERTLWIASSVAVIGVMPLYYAIWMVLDDIFERMYERGPHKPIVALSWICYTLYVMPRLYLLVAPFRDLFHLPPEAFIATWSISFPHVA